MAKSLQDWIESDVEPVKDKPLKWLSEQHFFRDPIRPAFSNTEYMYTPADGVIMYQEQVAPGDCIVDIKGKAYSLQDILRDDSFDKTSLVIGIFMTMYDVHVNRIPYAGMLSYKKLEPIRRI